MAKRPIYCGYEVIRVERDRVVLDRHSESVWYLVLVNDEDGVEARVGVSVDAADHYGTSVPTIEKAA